MRKHYATIYNQCVVLLVSHFGSVLNSIFVSSAPDRVGVAGTKDRLKEELKFTLAELRELGFDLKDSIGELLTAKRDISFQDMQSTSRAFAGYLGVEVLIGATVNNIILAQAARHVIVHGGGIVDAKCLKQLRDTSPRGVMSTLSVGEELAFTPVDIQVVASSMREFVADIVDKLDAKPLIGLTADDGTNVIAESDFIAD